jgi:hypothetical protein
MTKRTTLLAHGIALACGALLATACKKNEEAKPAGEQTDKLVNCQGINECKGKSMCHTDKHSSAGQNACKGQGWIDVTTAECTNKGGTVVKVTRK